MQVQYQTSRFLKRQLPTSSALCSGPLYIILTVAISPIAALVGSFVLYNEYILCVSRQCHRYSHLTRIGLARALILTLLTVVSIEYTASFLSMCNLIRQIDRSPASMSQSLRDRSDLHTTAAIPNSTGPRRRNLVLQVERNDCVGLDSYSRTENAEIPVWPLASSVAPNSCARCPSLSLTTLVQQQQVR